MYRVPVTVLLEFDRASPRVSRLLTLRILRCRGLGLGVLKPWVFFRLFGFWGLGLAGFWAARLLGFRAVAVLGSGARIARLLENSWGV